MGSPRPQQTENHLLRTQISVYLGKWYPVNFLPSGNVVPKIKPSRLKTERAMALAQCSPPTSLFHPYTHKHTYALSFLLSPSLPSCSFWKGVVPKGFLPNGWEQSPSESF